MNVMNRSRAVVLIGSFLVLGACAHNNAVTTPVHLTVTSANASNRFVSDVRKETLKAISKYVPDARPMTVEVDLGVATELLSTTFNRFESNATRQRVVPSTSSDTNPANEGAPATVNDNSNFFFPSTTAAVTEVDIAYTIKDAGGKVIESNTRRFDLGSAVSSIEGQLIVAHGPYGPSMTTNGPFGASRMLVTQASVFLASRVKALSH